MDSQDILISFFCSFYFKNYFNVTIHTLKKNAGVREVAGGRGGHCKVNVLDSFNQSYLGVTLTIESC